MPINRNPHPASAPAASSKPADPSAGRCTVLFRKVRVIAPRYVGGIDFFQDSHASALAASLGLALGSTDALVCGITDNLIRVDVELPPDMLAPSLVGMVDKAMADRAAAANPSSKRRTIALYPSRIKNVFRGTQDCILIIDAGTDGNVEDGPTVALGRTMEEAKVIAKALFPNDFILPVNE